MGKKTGQKNEDAPQQPDTAYVMMRREADNDGPHPIHPDEVENYRQGGWVVVEGEK